MRQRFQAVAEFFIRHAVPDCGFDACFQTGADQIVLVGEHFVERAFRDAQRLCNLIDPHGTDAVAGDELLRRADDLFLGRSPFHYFSSWLVRSRPPPRA